MWLHRANTVMRRLANLQSKIEPRDAFLSSLFGKFYITGVQYRPEGYLHIKPEIVTYNHILK